jgi:glycosyltransferase A (GT-A) superfamily protein (DUF2064 family)
MGIDFARHMTAPQSTTGLGIFARHPQPGRVKTRLAAAWGGDRAAELYAAFVADTLDRFRTLAGRRWICHTPAGGEAVEYFQDLARGDYELWPQPECGLGERMAAFFESSFREGIDRVVIVGSDSPTLPREYVEQAFELLAGRNAHTPASDQRPVPCADEPAACVLGPATDGGYYLVGLRQRLLPVFSGMEWSTPQVLHDTLRRLNACGASLALLPPWYDVDDPEDVDFLRGHLEALRASGSAVPEHTAMLLPDLWGN